MDTQNQTSTIDRVRAMLASVFQVPLEEVPPTLAFGDLPQWDSMGHMEVVMRIEEEFGIPVDADGIAELTSVEAICARIEGQPHE